MIREGLSKALLSAFSLLLYFLGLSWSWHALARLSGPEYRRSSLPNRMLTDGRKALPIGIRYSICWEGRHLLARARCSELNPRSGAKR
jgi:hypothetical protein